MSKSKIDRCCCTCDRNKRIRHEDGAFSHCKCEIDGHRIGYVESFEHSCRRYALDRKYKPGGEWYDPENFERGVKP